MSRSRKKQSVGSVQEVRAKYLVDETKQEQIEGHVLAIKTTGEVRRFTSTAAAEAWLDEEGSI